MTLNFMTHFKDGTPTHFVEKIWQSFPDEFTADVFNDYLEQFINYDFSVNAIDMHPKIHTIRRDEKNRWKEGNDIHFVVKNRTPKRFQFAPVIKCVSVQEIKINPDAGFGMQTVIVDGSALTNKEIDELAINDGFENVEEFFKYFNEDFTGKLIHWTDKKY